jgi:hypothetical protein
MDKKKKETKNDNDVSLFISPATKEDLEKEDTEVGLFDRYLEEDEEIGLFDRYLED